MPTISPTDAGTPGLIDQAFCNGTPPSIRAIVGAVLERIVGEAWKAGANELEIVQGHGITAAGVSSASRRAIPALFIPVAWG